MHVVSYVGGVIRPFGVVGVALGVPCVVPDRPVLPRRKVFFTLFFEAHFFYQSLNRRGWGFWQAHVPVRTPLGRFFYQF